MLHCLGLIFLMAEYMKPIYRHMTAILRDAGYELVRHNGSDHQTWGKPNAPTVTFSRKTNDLNLLNKILKHAGVEARL